MSRSLKSYPENQRLAVARRRAAVHKDKNALKGLGAWGALDYLNKKGVSA